jgi:hypothetical protein
LGGADGRLCEQSANAAVDAFYAFDSARLHELELEFQLDSAIEFESEQESKPEPEPEPESKSVAGSESGQGSEPEPKSEFGFDLCRLTTEQFRRRTGWRRLSEQSGRCGQ